MRLYDFPAKQVAETDKALLLKVDADMDPVWLPKSQVEFDGETVTIPEGLVIEKGLDNLV